MVKQRAYTSYPKGSGRLPGDPGSSPGGRTSFSCPDIKEIYYEENQRMSNMSDQKSKYFIALRDKDGIPIGKVLTIDNKILDKITKEFCDE